MINEQSEISTQSGADRIIILNDDLSLELPSEFEFTCDVKTNIDGSRLLLGSKANANSYNYAIGSNRDANVISAFYRETSSQIWGNSLSKDDNYHTFKFIRNGNSFEAFVDGTSKSVKNLSWFDNYHDYTLYLDVWRSGTIYFKNIKIKPL